MATYNGLELNDRLHYGDSMYVVPELKAYNAKFADPLTLNFKLMIDYDKPYGLFAPDTQIDSALAYLKRIGEDVRYNMLVSWISTFKIFIKDYEFLLLECQGLDTIINKKPWETFGPDDKITFSIRETSDMLIQSLITQYRHIWFDNQRMVEVLPANLRRFDINILVYSAGYYNMALYDKIGGSTDVQTLMFPTLKKLSEGFFIANANNYDFNHHMVMLCDAEINNEDSGKGFFDSISNEPGGEMVKNSMVFNFRFGSYKGIFNNIYGEFDFVKVLAMAAAQDKVSKTTKSTFKEKLGQFIKDSGKEFKNAAKAEVVTLKQKPINYVNAIIKENTVIGNALKTITDPKFLPKMIKNTIDLGIQTIENKYIYDNIAKLNNLINGAYSDNFLSVYENYFDKSQIDQNIQLINNEPATTTANSPYYIPQPRRNVENGIKFQVTNVYDRRGF